MLNICELRLFCKAEKTHSGISNRPPTIRFYVLLCNDKILAAARKKEDCRLG